MERLLKVIAIVLTATVLTVRWTSEARAQNNVTYVSSHYGTNVNNCAGPSTPCANFAQAQSVLNDGGAIVCMDPGFYDNYFTVSKSLTIDCLAGGGALNAINIAIDAPGKTVRLRNLVVNAAFFFNTPQIDIQAASRVYLENVMVTGTLQGAAGLIDHRAGTGILTIVNSSFVSNSGPGIVIAPAGGTIGVELDNVRSAYNFYGIAVASGGRVMIKNSVFTGNGTAGIEADPGAFVSVSGTEVSFNSTGIIASGSVALDNARINSNSTAISGATQSLGNNLLFANSVNGTPPTIISGQ